MEFKFEINLRRMALLSTALSLWNKDDIQLKLKQYLYPYGRRGKEKFLIELINDVIKKVDKKSLPDVLYSELTLVIKDLGYKMNNWFYYLKRRKIFRDQSRRQIYDKFFKNIFWTHYGAIDEPKIIRRSWLNGPNADLVKIYVMACCYCMEDVIDDLWGKISLYEVISYENLCNSHGYHLVVYWNKLRENDMEGFFNDVIFSYSGDSNIVYDSNESAEVNMLKLSVRKGYAPAVKFFWDKIFEEDRSYIISFCLSRAFDLHFVCFHTEFYRKEQYTEIVLFLMNYLTEEQKRELFDDSGMLDWNSEEVLGKRRLRTLLKIGIFMWPWQELFPNIYKRVEDLLDEKQYKSLVRNIIREIEKNEKFSIPAQRSIAQRQLHQAWGSVPFNFKAEVIKQIYWDTLFKTWDLSSIKLILNNRNVAHEWHDLIRENYLHVISFVEEKKDDDLFEFIKEILIFGDWEQTFQEKVKLLYEIILKGDMNLANEILAHCSEDEKQNLKRKIDHKLLCYYFIVKDRYNVADAFLKWKFDEAESIQKFKNSFQKNEFTAKHISKLWKTSKANAEVAKTKSQNFLLWFLGDEITVLRYKFKFFSLSMFQQPGQTVYFDWDKFIDRNHFEVLEDFLNWCSFTEENCRIVKRTIVKEDIRITSVFHDYMKENLIDKAGAFLNWAFENDAEKNDFMRNFLVSRQGITACKLYIGKYITRDIYHPKPTREEIVEKFKKFINFFMKPYLENFVELKCELKNWPEMSRTQNEVIDDDEASTEEIFSEGGDVENETAAYCDIDNYNLFLSLLHSAETKGND